MRIPTNLQILPLIALLVLPAPAPAREQAPPPQARNIVILLVGGIRETEFLEEPGHTLARFTWNQLRPQGVWYRNFLAMGRTGQLTGQFALTTGVRQGLRGGNHVTEYPTWVEHWLEVSGADPASVVEIARTSESPIYRGGHPRWSVYSEAARIENQYASDKETTERFIEVLQEEQPRVAILVLNDPDLKAQHNDPPEPPYEAAVVRSDSLLFEVVQTIRRMPDYGDQTAIFLTDYHGRHDEEHGGVYYHGDSCGGCRNITFLALGPDFPAGRIVETEAYQEDLASTCAAILGSPLPFGEGRVMEELFEEGRAPRLARASRAPAPHSPSSPERLLHGSPRRSCWPDIALEGGRLHVAWSEENPDPTRHRWDILSCISTDGGESFGAPDTALASTPIYRPFKAAIAGDRDGYNGCVFAATVQRFEPWVGDSTWVWSFAIASRPSARDTIEGPFDRGNLNYWADQPAITAEEGSILAVGTDTYRRRLWVRAARVDSIAPPVLKLKSMQYPASPHAYAEAASIAPGPEGPLAFEALRTSEKSTLHVTRWQAEHRRWGDYQTLVDEDWLAVRPAGAYDRAWAVSHVFWKDNRAGEGFQIYASRNSGSGWEPGRPISESLEHARRPHAWAGEGIVAVVWEDVSAGGSRIVLALSRDGGLSFFDPVSVADGGTLPSSSYPRVIGEGGFLHIVWQDDRNGVWDIYYRRYSLS